MLIRTCLLLFFAASLAHAQPAGGKIKKELAELQGVWRLIGFEVDGKEAFLQEHKQLRWVIKDDKVFYGGDELARLTLDPAADPKCLDLGFVKSKRLHEGIYKLDKDRLKICVGLMTEGVKERPFKFDNHGIDKYRTMLFVRDKPGTELEGTAGFIGVQLRTDDKTKEIQVVETVKDSPAQKAGIKKDDFLLKVGSDAAEDLQQTVNLVRQLKPGSDAILRVRRAGKEQDITVKVGVAPFLFLDSGLGNAAITLTAGQLVLSGAGSTGRPHYGQRQSRQPGVSDRCGRARRAGRTDHCRREGTRTRGPSRWNGAQTEQAYS